MHTIVLLPVLGSVALGVGGVEAFRPWVGWRGHLQGGAEAAAGSRGSERRPSTKVSPGCGGGRMAEHRRRTRTRAFSHRAVRDLRTVDAVRVDAPSLPA